jgi:hypothetical protein
MQITEDHLLGLIEKAIDDAKTQSNGNKFHQGVRHGYVKALEQVQHAIVDKENCTAHLEVGVMR